MESPRWPFAYVISRLSEFNSHLLNFRVAVFLGQRKCLTQSSRIVPGSVHKANGRAQGQPLMVARLMLVPSQQCLSNS